MPKEQFNPDAFFQAAKDGDENKVEAQFNTEGFKTNALDKYGYTALIYAAIRGHLETVEALLSRRDIDINARDKHGMTALICAAFYGHREIVEALLQKRDDVNARDKDGDTALICAACNGHTRTVKALLSHSKIDVNKENKWGNTPLIWAAYNGHTKIVKALLKEGADINVKSKKGYTALEVANRENKTEVVTLLEEYQEKINKFIAGEIKEDAFTKKQIDLLLEEDNPTLPDKVKSDLAQYVEKKTSELKDFLDKGDIKKLDKIKPLVEKGIDTKDIWGATALHWAVNSRDKKTVYALINGMADVNATTREGLKPIHMAIKVGELSIVQALLSHSNIDVNATTREGLPPIHMAIEAGELSIVKALLSHRNIDLNVKDKDNRKAIFLALSKSCSFQGIFNDILNTIHEYQKNKDNQQNYIDPEERKENALNPQPMVFAQDNSHLERKGPPKNN